MSRGVAGDGEARGGVGEGVSAAAGAAGGGVGGEFRGDGGGGGVEGGCGACAVGGWVGWGLVGLGGRWGGEGFGGRGRRHGKELHVACTIGCGIITRGFTNGDFSRWRRFGVYHMEKVMDLGFGWHVLDVAEPRVSAALSMRQVYCDGFDELLKIQQGSQSHHVVHRRVS